MARCRISGFNCSFTVEGNLGSNPIGAFQCRFACSSHADVDFLRVLQFPLTSKDTRVKDTLLTLLFAKVPLLHLFIEHQDLDSSKCGGEIPDSETYFRKCD